MLLRSARRSLLLRKQTPYCVRAILLAQHIFVNVVTFHGGLNAIGYPWGNYVHIKHDNKATEAPDLTALQDVAKIMKSYSGSTLTTNNIKDYSTGDMVQMVMIIFIFRVIL